MSRNTSTEALLALTFVAFIAAPTFAQSSRVSVPSCSVVHSWPTLPTGEILGQATGVGVDSRGAVLVFHRANRTWIEPFPTDQIAAPTIWAFEGKTGRFLRSWGAGMFVMPHGLTVDRNDNVWLTDVGRQQVFKFAADGRLLSAEEHRAIDARLTLLADATRGGDHRLIRDRTEELDRASKPFAERRMNEGMQRAIGGHKVAEIAEKVEHAKGTAHHGRGGQ